MSRLTGAACSNPQSRIPKHPVNLWSSALISTFMLLCAAGLMLSHFRTWRRFRQQELGPDEYRYRRRQFRRRMQTSAMLALLAVAIFAGDVLTQRIESKWFSLCFWSGVLLGVLGVGLLAAADIWATKYYYDRLRQSYLIEKAKLQVELRRIQSKRSNGEAGRRRMKDEG